MQIIGSELSELRRKLRERDVDIKYLQESVASLESALQIAEQVNADYREFFRNKPELANWMRWHNVQFQAFKASPYYIEPPLDFEYKSSLIKTNVRRRLSTIDKNRDE